MSRSGISPPDEFLVPATHTRTIPVITPQPQSGITALTHL